MLDIAINIRIIYRVHASVWYLQKLLSACVFRQVKEQKMGECFHDWQEELGFSKECCPVRLHDDGGNTLSGHYHSQVKK